MVSYNEYLSGSKNQSISGTTDQIAHSNTAYNKDNTEPSKEIEEMKKLNHQCAEKKAVFTTKYSNGHVRNKELKFSKEVTTVIRGTIIPAKLLIIPATYATIGNT
ncbi:11336_t:CDS:2 [Entrophospora sp. SA101]|nr:11336_t:CDS:2 [Entrophospora sp. SA101]